MPLAKLLDWRLHVLVILISLLSEAIGILRIPMGPGTLLLLPLFYAFIFGVLVNPNVKRTAGKLIPNEVSQAAGSLILLSIMPFIAREPNIIWLGNGEESPALHNPHYDFNDQLTPIGIEYWVRLIRSLLGNRQET